MTEYLLIPVAQAAEKLGLPTSPSTSFIKSVNKNQTRLVDSPTSCNLVSSLDALRSQLASEGEASLPPGPPWIVKPCVITRLGFRSGVFHVEALVRDSSTCYRAAEDVETLDLRPSLESAVHPATVFLVEINARPPGYVDTYASYYAIGIDLFALRILIALGDEPRLRVLSQPFHSRLHVVVSAIQATKSGIIASEDPWEDRAEKDPTLTSHVVHHVMGFSKGGQTQDPRLDTTPWLSAFTAYPRKNRAEALKFPSQIKKEFECEIADLD